MEQNRYGGEPLYQLPLNGAYPFHIHRSPDIYYPLHWHCEMEIIYLLDGETDVYVDEKTWHLKKEDVLFIGSTSVHSIPVSPPGLDALVIEIGFFLLGTSFQPFSGKSFVSPLLSLGGELTQPQRELKALLQRLAENPLARHYCPEPAALYLKERLTVCSELYKLTAFLVENMELREQSPEREKRFQMVNAMQTVLSFVRENYEQPIPVSRAAALVGYEKTRFCQLFKKAMGVSFHRYLINYRLQVACSLLRETDLPIAAVADQVGMPQAKTFCRLFRDRYAVTPSEYRHSGKPDAAAAAPEEAPAE